MASEALVGTLMGSLSTFIPLMLMYNSSSSGSSPSNDVNANMTGNATNTDVSPLPFSLPLPPVLLSLIIKNQDFLKLMILGGVLETCRRYASSLWEWILSQFYFTVHFESTDDTYEWMMAWLTKKGVWTTSREIYITSTTWGNRERGMDLGRQNSVNEDGDALKKRKLSYLPVHQSQHWIKHRNVWISVVREKEENNDRWSSSTKEKLTVKIYCRDQRFVRTLLEDAKRCFGPDDDETVNIHTSAHWGAEWRLAFSRRKRPISSIILESEIKQKILDDCRDFLDNEQWYIDRGIPYRRGYLLHGVPGSGKTSLIHSIAGELDLDVYMVSLSKKGIDDSDLLELMTQLPGRCIALIEDVDVAFKGTKRTNVAGAEDDEDEQPDQNTKNASESEPKSGVTLSGLLNALDGLVAQEGRLLFATTNCVEALDDALRRPGRMDVHIEFQNASRWQAQRLFAAFFPPTPSSSDEDDLTVQHFRSVPLTTEEAASLAERFSEAIPEGALSVASLQGFLLQYKDKPSVAVEVAPEWVKEEMEKRSKKLKDEADGKEKEKEKEKKAKSEPGQTSETSSTQDEDEAKGRRKRRRRRNK